MKFPALFMILSAVVLADVQKLPKKDLKGSHDHPLVGRAQGSVIADFSVKDYDVAVFPLKIDYSKGKVLKKVSREGKVTRIYYAVPGKISPIALQRTYMKSLKAKGLKVKISCSPCSKFDSFLFTDLIDKRIEPKWGALVPEGLGFLLMEGQHKGKRVSVGIYTYRQYGITHARVRVVEGEPLKLQLVVKAEEIKRSIREKGSVSIYGILFDHDSYRIKPASRKALEEIAKFLKRNPSVKLYVVGHTDNTGRYEYNLRLSRKRAEAVVKELVQKYGISPERLKPVGVGPVAPVDTNRTDEGRAKNRRVELVEM